MTLFSLANIVEQEQIEYLQQEQKLAYVNGTDDQWEGQSIDSLHRQMAEPIFQLRVNDSEDNRREFNRRFNIIVKTHTELWHNDDTPVKKRNRAYYAERYYMFFADVMRLLEKFPDAGSNAEYWSIVDTVRRYRKIMNEKRL